MTDVSTEKVSPALNPNIKSDNAGISDPVGIASFQAYSGPLPPPNFLMQYEQLVPGSAKRFLEEPHLEAVHRRELECKMVNEQIRLARRGQLMAFYLASFCIIASLCAIFLGYSLGGLGALIIAIGSFSSIFIFSRKKQS